MQIAAHWVTYLWPIVCDAWTVKLYDVPLLPLNYKSVHQSQGYTDVISGELALGNNHKSRLSRATGIGAIPANSWEDRVRFRLLTQRCIHIGGDSSKSENGPMYTWCAMLV